MAIKKIKISELTSAASLTGLYTIGTKVIGGVQTSVKVALQFLKDAADSANTAATLANDKATAAHNAATAAATAAGSANTAAAAVNNTNTLAAEAEAGRTQAEATRAEAETVRAETEASRATAETARATAETGRAGAEATRTAAESGRATAEQKRQTDTASAIEGVNAAATTAANAANRANAAAAISEELNAHPPIQQPGSDGNLTWWIWNPEDGEYANTALPARGPQGKPLTVLENGNYAFWNDATEAYEDSNIPAAVTVDLDELKALAFKDKVNYSTDIENIPSTFTPSSHTHTKEQITDFPASLKNPSALTLSLNGASQGSYDGSEAKSIDITPSSIGAAPANHTHSYLPLSGGTLTGRLINSLSNADMWISGMTEALLDFTAVQTEVYYHAYLRVKNYLGHVVNLGGLGNRFGFFGFLNGRTENGADWGSYIDMSTGNWTHEKIFTAGQVRRAGSSDSYLLLGGGGHKLISDLAAKTVQKTATLATATWTGSGPYTYVLSDEAVTANSFVTLWPGETGRETGWEANRQAAKEADIYEDVTTGMGTITIKATNKPDANISIKYTIEN
jgi:hypothetical protein